MPKTKPSYPPEFRREAVELLRFSGRPVKQIAAELGVSEASLREWRKRADVDAGQAEGLTTDEKAELRELRKRVRIVEMERDVLKKRRSSSPGTARSGDRDLRVHRCVEDRLPDLADVQGPGRVALGLLRLGRAPTVASCDRRRRADRADHRDPHGQPEDLRLAAGACRARARARHPRRT